MHTIAWWPTVVVVCIATVTDLRSRRIPNWLVVPFMLAGFAASGWFHGITGVLHSAEGFALGAAIYGVLYLLGGMGMGDLKLLAAIGTWVWPQQLLLALVFTSIVGGIMAIGLALSKGFAGELFANTGNLLSGFRKRGLKPHEELVLSNPLTRKMPYAPAIALGTILSFFSQ